MKRTIVVALMAGMLLLVAGCAQSYEPNPEPTMPPNPVFDNGAVPSASTPALEVNGLKPPEDRTWISPGKVNVGNCVWTCPEGHRIPSDMPRDWAECLWCGVVYPVKLSDWEDRRFYPGATAEYPLIIHNGNDKVAIYAVYYKVPNHVAEGYAPATIAEQDWVIVADPTPVLMPRETRDILITVSMPDKAVAPGPKWEFWVGVTEQGQGMVRTELACRWLIVMRD